MGAGSKDPRAAHALLQAMHAASQHYRAGQWSEAERLCRALLERDPHHPEALHLLGVMANGAGDAERAAELLSRALKRRPRDAGLLNDLGSALRDLGRLEEAGQRLRRALALAPTMAEAHYNLGIVLEAEGRLDGAETAYGRAAQLRPELAEASFHLGAVCQRQGKLAKAEAAYLRGLERKPEFAEGCNNLGIVCHEQGKLETAEALYRRAVALKPGLAEAHNNLGLALQEGGKAADALACHEKALELEPDNGLFWVFFAQCAKSAPAEATGRIGEPLLVTALKRAELDPQQLAGVAAARICRDPILGELSQAVGEAADAVQRVQALLAEGALKPVLENPLLLALLEEAIVPDYRLERALTLLRRAMLHASLDSPGTAGEPTQRFAAALALQCFANEYVYEESSDEERSVEALSQRAALAFETGAAIPAAWLLVLAAYRPLHALGFSEARLRELCPGGGALAAVLERQLVEPAEEERLKQAIPRLTGIADGVSVAVRAQYEENPYPRWSRIADAGEPRPMHAVLRRLFPGQEIADTSPERPEILVAGCGTGSHSVQAARNFRNARVLAVDLSRASLAYAERATRKLGLANVEYQQADILELASLGRRFDLIESCGVLHHMSEPMQGWSILAGLLRPRGYLKVGLYSRRARSDISAARELIAERGYAPVARDIRRCRREIAAGHPGFDAGRILSSTDFYSTSACRDLLFHVQERLFSPAELEACLAHLGLEFLGFEFDDPRLKNRYRERFPEDAACNSLANWEAFEHDHPYTFVSMYEIWTRRASRA